MQCPFCKNEISDNSKFCTVCGAKIYTGENTSEKTDTDFQYRHYKSPEDSTGTQDTYRQENSNIPPYGTYVPPYGAQTQQNSSVPPYSTDVPPYGTGINSQQDNQIKKYLKDIKDIKILAIAGVCTSLGYIGIILAVISFVFTSRLPAEGSFFIPMEYASQYEDAKKSLSVSKTLNIITLVICVIRIFI